MFDDAANHDTAAYAAGVSEGSIRHACELSILSPPARVFEVLTDFERYMAQWASGPIEARKLTPGPTAPGTRFQVTAKLASVRMRSPYVITGLERDRRFAGDGIAGPVRFSEEYRLDTDRWEPSGTRLRYEMQAEPRGIFRLVRRPLSSQLRRLLDADLARFKTLVESIVDTDAKPT